MGRKLTVIDLFAGIGGFSLGLHRAGGFETVKFCEMKPHAQAVLAKNFPGVECHPDVTTFPFEQGQADVITAGFPCQDISYAGEGAGLAGSRSGLYREVVRALRVVRPKWAVLENVAALLSRGLGTVLGDVASVGYDAEWHCIPASAAGAPHRRDRIWIVAHPRGEQHEGCRAPLSGSLATQLSEAYVANASRGGHGSQLGSGQDTGAAGTDQSEGDQREWLWPELGRSSEALADAGSVDVQGLIASESDQEERQGPEQRPSGSRGDGLGWWSVEPGLGRVAHGIPNRVDRLEELGNAVVPQIPEIIGRAILESMREAA